MGKRILKYFGSVITILCILVVALFTVSIIYSRINPSTTPSILGLRPMNVLSGSMRPLLQPGDMVITVEKGPSAIKVGDVITFKDTDSLFVTHRVISVDMKGEGLLFTTRGDANNVNDQKPVPADNVVGVMLFNVPYGGYISNFIKSPTGIITLVTIVIVLFIISKVVNILSKERQNKNKTGKDPEGNMNIYNQP